MLNFADLSFSQKKFVVSVVEFYPQFKEDCNITLKQVVEITQDWAKNRENGSPKVGYPNWMFKSNKLDKGVYQLPLPTEDELEAYAEEVDAKANPVKRARAKVAKLQNAKKVMVNEKTLAIGEELSEDESRLQAIIGETDEYDLTLSDDEFNSILSGVGIEVSGTESSYR